MDDVFRYLERSFTQLDEFRSSLEKLKGTMADTNLEGSVLDQSSLTIRQNDEYCNIKLKYEDRITSLQEELRLERTRNQKFKDFLTQKCGT